MSKIGFIKAAALASFSSLILASTASFAATDLPSREEMWRIIQEQQKQISELKALQEKTQQQVAETDEKVEAANDAIELVSEEAAGGHAGHGHGGHGGHGGPSWYKNTQIGGYGELHYNALRDNDDDEVDFHRFVLHFGHQFNDHIRLNAELELEHAVAGEGEEGEVELEQAFVEFDLGKNHQAKTGVFLLPVGILNEVHEPTTFFGVERNPIETNIIPVGWWEAGVGFNGQLGKGFSYDVAFHSGLNADFEGDDAFNIRSARQKVSEADADKGAVTGRVKWTGVPGVELATTLQYQQDVTQANSNESVEALFVETHADIRRGPWGLRALYARWDLDGAAPELLGRDEQEGWYIEPSYRFDTSIGEWGIFARYNVYDTSAGSSEDTEFEQYDIGVNFWPHPDVVLKADVQFNEDPGDGDDDEILNLGVGFQF